MRLTNHAWRRSIARGIPPQIVETIYSFGSAQPSRGALSLTLDARAIALAVEDDRRRAAMLARYRGCYLVVGDDERVLTVARRHRRFRPS